MPVPSLSIIIPTLNEGRTLGRTLGFIQKRSMHSPEVLVVDGGSRDGTQARVNPPIQLVQTAPGRAHQMNQGAAVATGKWLLFLHGDSEPPPRFEDAIFAAERKGCGVGAFRLHIQGAHPLLPLLAWGANQRSRWRHIFLGDQGIFILREVFFHYGGFAEEPLLEDYLLALTLKKARQKVYLSPLKMTTSGRRWDTHGFWRTWWLFRRIFHHHRRGTVYTTSGEAYVNQSHHRSADL